MIYKVCLVAALLGGVDAFVVPFAPKSASMVIVMQHSGQGACGNYFSLLSVR